jgi:TonB family protein
MTGQGHWRIMLAATVAIGALGGAYLTLHANDLVTIFVRGGFWGAVVALVVLGILLKVPNRRWRWGLAVAVVVIGALIIYQAARQDIGVGGAVASSQALSDGVSSEAPADPTPLPPSRLSPHASSKRPLVPSPWAPPRPPLAENDSAAAFEPAVPEPPPEEVASVCLLNWSASEPTFAFRWGEGPWVGRTLAARGARQFVLPLRDRRAAPVFSVRFAASGGGEPVERKIVPVVGPRSAGCTGPQRYRFRDEHWDGGAIVALSPEVWTEGWPHPWMRNVVAAPTIGLWEPAPGHSWLEPDRAVIADEDGIVGMSLSWNEERSLHQIATVLPGGPAALAGVAPGDFVYEVQGEPPPRDASERIIGRRGSYVTLLLGDPLGRQRFARVRRIAPAEVARLVLQAEADTAAPRDFKEAPSADSPFESGVPPRPSSPPTATGPEPVPGQEASPPVRPVHFTTPVPIDIVQPHYPEPLRQRRIAGLAILHVVVDERGGVRSVEVVDDPGFGLGNEAAKAVRRWRFRPGTRDGLPIEMTYEAHVRFDPARR